MADNSRGVLFIGAHPDDETIMAGGTLAMLRTRGVPTHILCATDGRGGESGGVPGADTPDERARIRLEELRCAAIALGASNLTWLGYIDPIMGPDDQLFGFAADEETLAAQFAGIIREWDVDVVLTHGSDGEYGHPAHVQIHRAVLRAAREHTPDVLVYGGCALVPTIEDRLWNMHDRAHLALDITPWQDAKIAAMLCHATQHELFKRRRSLQTVQEAIRLVEAFHRHWPPVSESELPEDAFGAVLRAAGAWTPEGGEKKLNSA
jgi:LmbE family N-acetylglucosaminyl deacetylase